MEPTLESKLQGDYRTGKRINMKKVPVFLLSLVIVVTCSPFFAPLKDVHL
jgi:hypothetical protein